MISSLAPELAMYLQCTVSVHHPLPPVLAVGASSDHSRPRDPGRLPFPSSNSLQWVDIKSLLSCKETPVPESVELSDVDPPPHREPLRSLHPVLDPLESEFPMAVQTVLEDSKKESRTKFRAIEEICDTPQPLRDVSGPLLSTSESDFELSSVPTGIRPSWPSVPDRLISHEVPFVLEMFLTPHVDVFATPSSARSSELDFPILETEPPLHMVPQSSPLSVATLRLSELDCIALSEDMPVPERPLVQHFDIPLASGSTRFSESTRLIFEVPLAPVPSRSCQPNSLILDPEFSLLRSLESSRGPDIDSISPQELS